MGRESEAERRSGVAALGFGLEFASAAFDDEKRFHERVRGCWAKMERLKQVCFHCSFVK